jgi:ABC-type oligopeptide transport system ATPase subunit
VMCQGRILEYGDTNEVICNPQKAYTQRLIKAVPKIRKRAKLLI